MSKAFVPSSAPLFALRPALAGGLIVAVCAGFAIGGALPASAQSEVPELLGGPTKPPPAPRRPRVEAPPPAAPATPTPVQAAPRVAQAAPELEPAPPPSPATQIASPAPPPAQESRVVVAEAAPVRQLPPPLPPLQIDPPVRSIDLAETFAPPPAARLEIPPVVPAAYRPSSQPLDEAAAAAAFCVAAADGALRADGYAGAVANGPAERVRRTIYEGGTAPTRIEVETPVIASRGWGPELALASCRVDGDALRSVTFRWLGATP